MRTTPTPTPTVRPTSGPLSQTIAIRAALAAAVLVPAGDAYHLFVLNDRPTQANDVLYLLHGLSLIAGLLLLVLSALSLAPRGRLTAIALPTLLVGSTLVIGDIWAEVVVLPGIVAPTAPHLLGDDIGGTHLGLVVTAYAVFALGWVLYAVSALRWAAPPAAWLLVIGGALAFLPVGGSYMLLSVGAAAVAVTASGSRAGRVDHNRH